MEERTKQIYECDECKEKVGVIYADHLLNQWLCFPCLERLYFTYSKMMRTAEAELRHSKAKK